MSLPPDFEPDEARTDLFLARTEEHFNAIRDICREMEVEFMVLASISKHQWDAGPGEDDVAEELIARGDENGNSLVIKTIKSILENPHELQRFLQMRANQILTTDEPINSPESHWKPKDDD